MALDQEDRRWISEVWAALIREALGQPLVLPAWVDRLALSRVTVSSTGILKTFAAINAGKPYDEWVKPFNFGLSAIVAKFGDPAGADPAKFHLLGSHEKDPRRWLEMPWYDKYSGETFRVGVGRDTPGNVV